MTCDCAPQPIHTDPAQCAANRQATGIYMAGIAAANLAGGLARGDRLRAEHHTHLRPAYGCPACPIDGRFVRDSAAGEWYVPTPG